MQPDSALSTREILIAPFRALRASGFTLLAFEASIFIAAAVAAAILPSSFANLSATWFPPGSNLLKPVLIAQQALGLLVVLVILLVTVALPTRIIWLYHELKISRLLLDFSPALGRCARTAMLLWRRVMFFVLAACAAYVISAQISHTPPKGQLALYVVITCLSLISFYHGLRFVLALLTTIVVRLDVETQLLHIDIIVQRCLMPALLVCALGSMVPLLIYFIPEFSVQSQLAWPLIGVSAWYILTALGVVCLESAEKYARVEGRTFRVVAENKLTQ